MEPAPSSTGNVNALDVLDRVLEKGLVIAGDIRISLLNVELLTIRIRLLMCAIEKAEQLGLDWWNYDRYLRPRALPRARKPAGRIVAPSPRAQYGRTESPAVAAKKTRPPGRNR